MQNCSLFTYSERAWQQCALFQNASSALLQRTGYQGSFSSTGQSSLRVYDTWAFHSSITDLATNQTGTSCSSGRQHAEAKPLQDSRCNTIAYDWIVCTSRGPNQTTQDQSGLEYEI